VIVVDCVFLQAAKCQDPIWAVLFIVHVLAIVVVALWKGVPFLNAVSAATGGSPSNPAEPTGDDVFSATDLLQCLAASAAVGAVLSGLFVVFLIRNAKALIIVTVYAAIGMNLAGAVLCGFFLGWPFALPWLFFALLSAAFWWCMRRHIPFAAANLSIAAKAVGKACGTIAVAYATIALTVAWVMVWGVAALGSIASIAGFDPSAANATNVDMVEFVYGASSRSSGLTFHDDNNDNNNNNPYADDDGGFPAGGQVSGTAYGVGFVLLVSFYWGVQVLRNTLHVVTAGTVGTWWATSSGGDPTWGSLKRACSTSFGSIALGSLIIAVIQAIRAFAEGARNNARRNGNFAALCCAAFAVCLIRMLEDIMRYFTAYAFCQVALYGTNFWESGRNAFLLFTRRGWMAVFNDVIIERSLMLAALLFGAICAVFSFFISGLFVDKGSPEDIAAARIIAGVSGFVVGFLMCAIIAGIIESAVKTVFVCFAERPEALMASHPDEFAEIMGAWYGLKPDLITGAGYDRQFSVASTDYA
jgi:hypothetical protein